MNHRKLSFSSYINILFMTVVTEHRFRLHTPALHAVFLQFMNSFSWHVILECMDAASAFYTTINELLDRFYPFKTISTSSRDPPFVTPEIKYLLRRKNKLQRSGNLEAAACLAKRISKKITSSNASSFSKPCSGPKDLWERVNKITGWNKTSNTAAQFNAEMLNRHYASMSTDSHYVPPIHKLTVF